MFRSLVLFLALVLVPSAARAVDWYILFDAGLGVATDVDVGGQLYNVGFENLSCVDLFSDCGAPSDFTFAFTSQEEADAASQALLDQVLIDLPSWAFDTDPGLTLGCTFGATQCAIYTPYATSAGLVSASLAVNSNAPDGSGDYVTNSEVSISTPVTGFGTYAVWIPVPEPSTALLMASGLALLAVRRPKAAS